MPAADGGASSPATRVRHDGRRHSDRVARSSGGYDVIGCPGLEAAVWGSGVRLLTRVTSGRARALGG